MTMLTIKDYCRDHWHAVAVGLRSTARWSPLYAVLAVALFLLLVVASGDARTESWGEVAVYGVIYAASVAAFRSLAYLIADRIDDR